MKNNQSGLQTASHNIANKSVPGFSRQTVDFATQPPDASEGIPIGKGADISSIKRENNAYLEKQLVRENNKLGYAKTDSDILQRIEKIYSQMEKGINESLVEFFNSIRELSSQPESLISRTLVKNKAEYLTQDFNKTHRRLTDVQGDIDFQIKKHLIDINQISKEIINLNRRIQSIESSSQSIIANDERDQRDHLLKKLGEYVDINYSENKQNSLTVTAGKSILLVSGGQSLHLFSSPSPKNSQSKGKREGLIDIFYKPFPDARSVLVTHQFTGGKIGSLLKMRDKVVSGIIKDMDNLAYSFAKRVNEEHQSGFNSYNNKGESLFILPNQIQDTSQKIRLNENIKNDVGKIVTAKSPYSPADNRVANKISNIQQEKIMEDKRYTLGEFYRSLIGNIGLLTRRANQSLSSQKDAVDQLNNFRESISGVNLDEETAKMIDYQKSYEASARLIRVAEEMMNTVLDIKKL